MLTVNFETAHAVSDALREIRNLNPKIKILAWISLGFYRISEDSTMKGWGGYLETKFLADSNEDWWIRIYLTAVDRHRCFGIRVSGRGHRYAQGDQRDTRSQRRDDG